MGETLGNFMLFMFALFSVLVVLLRSMIIPTIIGVTIFSLIRINRKNTHSMNSDTSTKIHTITSIAYFGIALLGIPFFLSNLGPFISFIWAMGSIIISRILINKNKKLFAYLILFSILPVWLFYLQVYGISPYLHDLEIEENAQAHIQYGTLDLDANSYTPNSKNFSCSLIPMGVDNYQFLYEDNFDLNTGTGYLRVLNEISEEINITYTPTNDTDFHIENFKLKLNDWIDEEKIKNPNLIVLNGSIENSINDTITQSIFLPKETIVPPNNISPGTSAGYLTAIMFFKKGNYHYTFIISQYEEIYFNPPQKEFGSVTIEHRRKADEIITKLLEYRDEYCEFLE